MFPGLSLTPSDFDATSIWLPLIASILTGAIIGFERELRAKAAGLRTHTLVCFSSAMLMVAASHQNEWIYLTIPGTNVVSDPTRMAHGILTGIGFLGAGVIFRQGSAIHGMTTAASLWITAALGVLYGSGLFWLALAGSVATLVVLVAFRVLHAVIPDSHEIAVSLVASVPAGLPGNGPGNGDAAISTEARIDAILAGLGACADSVLTPAWHVTRGGHGDLIRLTATLRLRGQPGGTALTRDLLALPGVSEVTLTPQPLPQHDPGR